MKTKTCISTFIIGAAAAWAGCTTTDDGVVGDDQNVTAESDCDVVDERTGKKLSAEELGKLDDPVAKKVLAGKGCPKSFQEIAKKMEKTDAKGCGPGEGVVLPGDEKQDCPQGDGAYCGGNGIRGDKSSLYNCFGGFVSPSGFCEAGCAAAAPGDIDKCNPGAVTFGNGVSTRFVSERAQVLGEPDSYRAVVKRQCSGRTDHEFFVSAFGIRAQAKELPGDVELIGEDKTAGVFNYYAREENKWKFFGNSKDFVTAGYDCENGACQSKAKVRCAGCHTGGGLVMKELQSPWVHWEGATQTPGVPELVSRFPMLGRKGDGIDLEGSVLQGNSAYVLERIKLLEEKGVAEVLRPLFCTLDVNLQSASGSGVVSFLNTDLFIDPMWQVFDGVQVDSDDYIALLARNKQRIQDGSRTQLDGKRGIVTDTFFAFTYPSRVSTNLDAVYNNALVQTGVIDDDFAKDVLHVDFTRPIFSKDRCALLAAAPKLDKDKMTPESIREGFKAGLAGKSGAAAKLLANLEKKNDQEAHKADVAGFIAACKARPRKDLLADAMTHASRLRNRFRDLTIAEFAETLPFDDVPDGDTAWNPETCTLE